MDNASYHSRVLNKTPNSSWNKADLVVWIKEQNPNTTVTGNESKAELLHLAKSAAQNIKTLYVVDEMALQHGREVLRLLLYHCHFRSS
ncbi:hypothetical protein BDFB_014901 [Asbolus verrucosus]|uniref:DDE 3 domain containing protein n=1 Tax=Asbolus verrucosus TaxID=1661398 RepID=A0A482VD60_ASBVE|nr:hypothetical protein BDFB_014901 [Asbolus verrucosus]